MRPGRRTAAAAAALLLLSAGCTGAVGTIDIEVVAAPGSDLVQRIQRARLTLTIPRRVIEAERDASGDLALSLELDAAGVIGFAEIEGFDAGGDRIAFGRTGPLPILAVDASITIYVAPPMSLAEAPDSLDPPRFGLAAAPLPFGVLLAGGTDAGGGVSDALAVYNVYQHELQEGDPLVQGGRHLPIAVSASGSFAGLVYLFGGLDETGEPTGDLVLFDSGAAPAGRYFTLDDDAELARAGVDAAPLGDERYVVVGDPPVLISGIAGELSVVSGAPALGGAAASTETLGRTDAVVVGAGTGDSGALVFEAAGLRELEAPPEALRTGHRAASLPLGAGVLFAGGETDQGLEASAVVYETSNRRLRVIEDFLATPRLEAAVAATSYRIVVAGGVDAAGDLVGDAEVFDAETLEPLAVLPLLVPRRGAVAAPLANGQILVAGGLDAEGQPVGLLELFTPEL